MGSGRLNTRLSGHGLISEGSAFVIVENMDDPANADFWIDDKPYRSPWHYEGVGICSCGETSAVLKSNGARKRWHRAHKDAIRGES